MGAPRDETATGATGSVRVFRRTGLAWDEVATLLPGDREAGAGFGAAVAFDGSGARLIVGMPHDRVTYARFGEVPTGTARVFVREAADAYGEEATLGLAEAVGWANLGGAVALDAAGERAFVASAVRLLVYRRDDDAWGPEAELFVGAVPNGRSSTLATSFSIDAAGRRCLIGAPDGLIGSAHGFASTFVRSGTTWREELLLLPRGITPWDGFGRATALSQDGAVAFVFAPYIRGPGNGDDRDIGTPRMSVFHVPPP